MAQRQQKNVKVFIRPRRLVGKVFQILQIRRAESVDRAFFGKGVMVVTQDGGIHMFVEIFYVIFAVFFIAGVRPEQLRCRSVSRQKIDLKFGIGKIFAVPFVHHRDRVVALCRGFVHGEDSGKTFMLRILVETRLDTFLLRFQHRLRLLLGIRRGNDPFDTAVCETVIADVVFHADLFGEIHAF